MGNSYFRSRRSVGLLFGLRIICVIGVVGISSVGSVVGVIRISVVSVISVIVGVLRSEIILDNLNPN